MIGAAERRAAVREVLAELLAGRVALQWHERGSADIVAAIRRAGAEDLALAHVYVDLREPPLLVYIGDRGHARVLIRRVALPASFDESAREEIGTIVSSAIDALCAGGTIGITRAQAAPEPPSERMAPPAAPPLVASRPPSRPAERRWSGGVLARYRMMAWAPLRLQHMLELGGALRRRVGRVDPQAALWVGAVTPSAVSSATDASRLAGATLHAELGVVTSLTPRWAQLAAVGGGVELLRGANERWAAVPMLRASLGLRATLGRGVVVELHAHAACDLLDTRVLDATSGQVLLDPWRVRPGISLTFGWSSPR